VNVDFVITLLAAAITVGAPILFGALGETLGEKAGHMNLGAEGLMLMGAVVGFKVAYATANPLVSLLAAALTGAVFSMVYAFLTVSLRCNQIITGLTLTTFGQGFANFIGSSSVGTRLSESFTNQFVNVRLPLLGDIPFIGRIFFQQNILVYLSYALVALIAVYMYLTRAGLRLKIVGENPAAADVLGISVNRYKYGHIFASGLLYGMGGAYIVFTTIPTWQNNIVSGRGWIAVALVIFATWNPIKNFFGAALFGLLLILGVRLQQFSLPISLYFFDMLPYLMTIIILFIGSFRKGGSREPGALGSSYFRESR